MRTRVLLLLSAALVVVAGCTGGAGNTAATTTTQGAQALLHTSSASMSAVTSVQFSLAVAGDLSAVPVHNATGSLTKAGDAKGSAQITEFGQLVQVDFVLIGDTFYIKGPTGGYQKLSASLAKSLFDPTAILDPNRGIAHVLASVQNPQPAGGDTVNGTAVTKVTGKVSGQVAGQLVPGISTDVNATLWLADDAKALPVKAEFVVPTTAGKSGATVDVTLTNYNQPVTVTAPAG
ncbi:MAG TPA: LppX_LprAFG lipoprotein [Pseudonocardiaceae bacterium]